MSKRASLLSGFQKLNALSSLNPPTPKNDIALDARKSPEIEKDAVIAPHVSTPSQLLNSDERGSKLDTAYFEQGENLTGSKTDTVKNEQGEKRTLSNFDPQVEDAESAPTSESDSVRTARNFTAVPNEILRRTEVFSDPTDFMIYLHLYSFSYGFGRRTASMGQAQLERFTGASRNTIKRSLERLVEQGWIEQTSDYQHGRVSRTWRVFTFEEKSPERKRRRGLKPDTVKNEQCSNLTERGSNSHPVRGSKIDPYKERDPKEKQKYSLSAELSSTQSKLESEPQDEISEYLKSIPVERKKRREKEAFVELQCRFTRAEISSALTWLKQHGLPGTQEPCHSPMAFLGSGGITRVLDEVRKLRQAEQMRQATETEARIRELKVEQEDREVQAREAAFCAEFPRLELQRNWILKLSKDFPMFSPDGVALRNIAIARWWDEHRLISTQKVG